MSAAPERRATDGGDIVSVVSRRHVCSGDDNYLGLNDNYPARGIEEPMINLATTGKNRCR